MNFIKRIVVYIELILRNKEGNTKALFWIKEKLQNTFIVELYTCLLQSILIKI